MRKQLNYYKGRTVSRGCIPENRGAASYIPKSVLLAGTVVVAAMQVTVVSLAVAISANGFTRYRANTLIWHDIFYFVDNILVVAGLTLNGLLTRQAIVLAYCPAS